MAPKGTSIIMYSSKKYLHHQFSVAGDWPGGVYITPTVAGELNFTVYSSALSEKFTDGGISGQDRR